MGHTTPVTLVRYWGSYFKTPRQSHAFASLFERSAAIGWRTYLVCCKQPEDHTWLRPLLDIGTQIVYLPRPRGNFDLACVRRVYRLCTRLQCDILHCDNMHTSPLIGAALAGVPVRLWSKRSMSPTFETGRQPTLRDRLAMSTRVSCWLATRVLPVSRAVGDELIRLGIPSSKLLVFHNCLDASQFRNVDRSKARTALGYNDQKLVIATIGHAVPVKGWDVLIRAFADVAAEIPQARLLLVGSFKDPHERAFYDQLQQLINKYDLSTQIHFTGRLDDIAPVLAAADIFVMPSRSEGNCNALLEALVAGLPCVSTSVGSAPEIIRDGVNGFLVDRENPKQVADTFLMLARQSELRTKVSNAVKAQKVAITLDEYTERLLNLYESLLKHRQNRV